MNNHWDTVVVLIMLAGVLWLVWWMEKNGGPRK